MADGENLLKHPFLLLSGGDDPVVVKLHFRRVGVEADNLPHRRGIAIAGVVAMKPQCIIFDEPTAMLDPKGRQEIMEIIRELHEEGITVILITHFMEEAAEAERVVVMHEGKVLLDGTPAEVFSQQELIQSVNLDVPLAVELAAHLRARGIAVPKNIISTEEMVEFLCQYR